MTIPEIPPAHREAVIRAMFRADGDSRGPLPDFDVMCDAAIATLLRLGYRPPEDIEWRDREIAMLEAKIRGYRVAPGWVAWSHGQPNDGAMCLVYGAGEFFVPKIQSDRNALGEL